MINYSECCGKYIATTKIFKSKNILQTSKLVEGADYHCSRCKQRTTPAGNLKTEVATNCDPLKNNGNDMKPELSIEASKEFAKGNIDLAWNLALQSGCLVDGMTKDKWINLCQKSLIRLAEEQDQNRIVNNELSKID